MMQDDFEHVGDGAFGGDAQRAHALDQLCTHELERHAAIRRGVGRALRAVDGSEEELEQVHVVDEREQLRGSDYVSNLLQGRRFGAGDEARVGHLLRLD